MRTIAFGLGVLWLLGMLFMYTLGGFIHILLAAAVTIFILSRHERPKNRLTIVNPR